MPPRRDWADVFSKAKAEFSQSAVADALANYPADGCGVKLFELAFNAVLEHAEGFTGRQHSLDSNQNFIQIAKQLNIDRFFDYQSTFDTQVLKKKPDPVAAPGAAPRGRVKNKITDQNFPQSMIEEGVARTDIVQDDNWSGSKRVWTGMTSNYRTHIQKPDGVFLVDFNDRTFWIYVESDGDSKTKNNKYAWDHATKIMQAVDGCGKVGQEDNHAFHIRLNIYKFYAKLGETHARESKAVISIEIAKRFFEATVLCVKNMLKQMETSNKNRFLYSYWVNYWNTRSARLLSWPDAFRENVATPVYNQTKGWFEGQAGLVEFQPMYTTAYNLPIKQLGDVNDDMPIWKVKYHLPTQQEIERVLNDMPMEKHFLWGSRDLHRLLKNAKGSWINSHVVQCCNNGGPDYYRKTILWQEVEQIRRNTTVASCDYFDYLYFRVVDLIVNVQQFSNFGIWYAMQLFSVRRGLRRQNDFHLFSDYKKAFQQLIGSASDRLVDRKWIKLDPSQYHNNLSYRKGSHSLSAFLCEGHYDTASGLPALDRNLDKYIRQYNIPQAALFLRLIRCSSLPVLQELARQYKRGEMSNRMEMLLKQMPVCTESELRWLFEHILTRPIVLVGPEPDTSGDVGVIVVDDDDDDPGGLGPGGGDGGGGDDDGGGGDDNDGDVDVVEEDGEEADGAEEAADGSRDESDDDVVPDRDERVEELQKAKEEAERLAQENRRKYEESNDDALILADNLQTLTDNLQKSQQEINDLKQVAKEKAKEDAEKLEQAKQDAERQKEEFEKEKEESERQKQEEIEKAKQEAERKIKVMQEQLEAEKANNEAQVRKFKEQQEQAEKQNNDGNDEESEDDERRDIKFLHNKNYLLQWKNATLAQENDELHKEFEDSLEESQRWPDMLKQRLEQSKQQVQDAEVARRKAETEASQLKEELAKKDEEIQELENVIQLGLNELSPDEQTTFKNRLQNFVQEYESDESEEDGELMPYSNEIDQIDNYLESMTDVEQWLDDNYYAGQDREKKKEEIVKFVKHLLFEPLMGVLLANDSYVQFYNYETDSFDTEFLKEKRNDIISISWNELKLIRVKENESNTQKLSQAVKYANFKQKLIVTDFKLTPVSSSPRFWLGYVTQYNARQSSQKNKKTWVNVQWGPDVTKISERAKEENTSLISEMATRKWWFPPGAQGTEVPKDYIAVLTALGAIRASFNMLWAQKSEQEAAKTQNITKAPLDAKKLNGLLVVRFLCDDRMKFFAIEWADRIDFPMCWERRSEFVYHQAFEFLHKTPLATAFSQIKRLEKGLQGNKTFLSDIDVDNEFEAEQDIEDA